MHEAVPGSGNAKTEQRLYHLRTLTGITDILND